LSAAAHVEVLLRDIEDSPSLLDRTVASDQVVVEHQLAEDPDVVDRDGVRHGTSFCGSWPGPLTSDVDGFWLVRITGVGSRPQSIRGSAHVSDVVYCSYTWSHISPISRTW